MVEDHVTILYEDEEEIENKATDYWSVIRTYYKGIISAGVKYNLKTSEESLSNLEKYLAGEERL